MNITSLSHCLPFANGLLSESVEKEVAQLSALLKASEALQENSLSLSELPIAVDVMQQGSFVSKAEFVCCIKSKPVETQLAVANTVVKVLDEIKSEIECRGIEVSYDFEHKLIFANTAPEVFVLPSYSPLYPLYALLAREADGFFCVCNDYLMEGTMLGEIIDSIQLILDDDDFKPVDALQQVNAHVFCFGEYVDLSESEIEELIDFSVREFGLDFDLYKGKVASNDVAVALVERVKFMLANSSIASGLDWDVVRQADYGSDQEMADTLIRAIAFFKENHARLRDAGLMVLHSGDYDASSFYCGVYCVTDAFADMAEQQVTFQYESGEMSSAIFPLSAESVAQWQLLKEAYSLFISAFFSL
jgi:hypothetical protein